MEMAEGKVPLNGFLPSSGLRKYLVLEGGKSRGPWRALLRTSRVTREEFGPSREGGRGPVKPLLDRLR